MKAQSMHIRYEKNHEVKIALGDASFLVVSSDDHLINDLRNVFILSPSNGNSNFTLRIEYLSSLDSWIAKQLSSGKETSIGPWQKISYGDKKVKGYFQWADSQVHVLFDKILRPLRPCYLFALLTSAFYILEERKSDSVRQDSLFLHAAGIVKDDNGFIFTGPSGSGKTTVSMLSLNSSKVINDECIQLRQIKGVYRMSSAYIKSGIYSHEKIEKKLKYMFFLTKANQHGLQRVRGAEAAMRLLDTLVYPANFSSSLIESMSEKLRLVSDLANKVPCYEMHFSKDDQFWHEINKLKR